MEILLGLMAGAVGVRYSADIASKICRSVRFTMALFSGGALQPNKIVIRGLAMMAGRPRQDARCPAVPSPAAAAAPSPEAPAPEGDLKGCGVPHPGRAV